MKLFETKVKAKDLIYEIINLVAKLKYYLLDSLLLADSSWPKHIF
jgi:hypothetical protein